MVVGYHHFRKHPYIVQSVKKNHQLNKSQENSSYRGETIGHPSGAVFHTSKARGGIRASLRVAAAPWESAALYPPQNVGGHVDNLWVSSGQVFTIPKRSQSQNCQAIYIYISLRLTLWIQVLFPNCTLSAFQAATWIQTLIYNHENFSVSWFFALVLRVEGCWKYMKISYSTLEN